VGASRDCPIFGVPPIISGMGKATDFKLSQYFKRVHPNKSPLIYLEKGSVGVSRDCPLFGEPPMQPFPPPHTPMDIAR